MDKERSNTLIQALTDKGANRPCPRCGHAKFVVVAEAQITVADDPRWTELVPQAVPTVLIACSNCGFVSQHALGPLGLLVEDAHAG